ncbi:Endoribonuclease L-PSP [compost metagenome]
MFENIEIALADAGTTFDNVVKLGMYLTDKSNLGTLREIRDRFIQLKAPPTSTLVQVTAFFNPAILFEMDAIAVIDG